MSTFGDQVYQFGGVPVGGREALGIGNVYYVFQTTAYLYGDALHTAKLGQYRDGSQRCHATIQSALNAVKSLRNDYVILIPDHLGYTITAALDFRYRMNMKFLCPPAYSGYAIGCNRLAPITQSTTDTAIIPLTGHHCEVAGITFVNAASDATASGSAISAAANCGFYSNIHNNLFEMYLSGATNIPIIGNVTSGMAWSQIHHNRFMAYSGTGATQAALINIAANATGVSVDSNQIHLGDANTYTKVINNLSVKGSANHNTIVDGGATVTKAITISDKGMAGNNLYAGVTSTLAAGGTVDRTFVQNFAGLNGGTVQDNDT
jgi:hypothetical protein